MATDLSGCRVFPPPTRWPMASIILAILFCCWIFPARHSFAMADDALASSPFFGAASAHPPSDAQSRLKAEIAAELLLMAIGRHTYFLDGLLKPHSDQDADYEAMDERQHMQAAIALHLLQQLRFMEAIDEKLMAAAQETASSVLEYRIAMQVFFETLQRKLEQDGAMLTAYQDAEAQVRNWYQRLPDTRRRYAAVRTVAPSTLLRLVGRESTFVRRLAICTLFLEEARAANQRHHTKLAKNVLRLAHNSDAAQHIERIFQAAIDEMVADSLQDSQQTLDLLFQKLVEKMRSDVQLNSQSTRAKICAH